MEKTCLKMIILLLVMVLTAGGSVCRAALAETAEGTDLPALTAVSGLPAYEWQKIAAFPD